MLQEHRIFPTLISEIPEFLNKNECEKIEESLKSKKHFLKEHKALSKNALSSHTPHTSKDVLYSVIDSVDKSFKDNILKFTKKYAESSGFELYNEIKNSWFNIQNEGSILNNHTHPGSVLSGVIFLKVDNSSSPIYFFNPNPMLDFTNYIDTEYYYEYYYFNPQLGTLLLFPSWLKHGSNKVENKSNERISISFNVL